MQVHDDDVTGLGLAEVKVILESQFVGLKEASTSQLLSPLHELRSQVRDVQGKLDGVVKDLSPTREMTKNLALDSIAALNTKTTINPFVAAQLDSSDLFLRSEIISAVSISSVAKYVFAAFSDSLSEDVLETLRLFFFAPGAQARKKARRSDIGRKFVELRIRIIRNMVFTCQVGIRRERMSLLQPILRIEAHPRASLERSATQGTGLSGSEGASDSGRQNKGPYRAPAWATKGFIGWDDIDAAVSEILKKEVEETRQSDGIDQVADGGLIQTQSTKRRKTISSSKLTIREEISREIVKHMWKRWTDWVGSSRSEARKSFTLDMGVVFLEPNSRWKPMCSCNSVEGYIETVDGLPLTESSSLLRPNYEVISSNLRAFENMVKEFPNFLVTCQYNVEVFDDAEEMVEKQVGREVTMRRNVNILKVAAIFLTAYFQVSTLEEFLGGSQSSLKLICIVALGFYEVIGRASRPRCSTGKRELVSSETKELGLLIPGDTAPLNLLMDKCLRMTQEKYDAINEKEDNHDGSLEDLGPGAEIGSDDVDVKNVFL